MPRPRLNVLISGAGIAGPCLAYWLTRTRLDVSITIIERSPVPRVAGQAVDIRGAAIDIIKQMKLEEDIKSRHTTEEGTIFVNSEGKTYAKFEAGPGDTFTAEYEILRADLAGLFIEATKGLNNIKYVYGNSIKALDQKQDGVSVTFITGTPETFDVVVGADGSSSAMRPMILEESVLKDSYKFLGQYIAFFSIPSKPDDPKMWQWYNAPKGLSIMLRPHRNPATLGAYMCITTPAREQRDPAVEEVMDKGADEKKGILRRYLKDTGWQAERVLQGMDSADDFYMSRIAQVKLSKWTSGRAVLLGDAAFATFGIATSLAIESAYMLAGELSKMESSKDVPEALIRYEEVFRSLIVDMGDIPFVFPQMMMPQSTWGLTLRNSLLWLASKSKIYKLFQQGGAEKEFKLPLYDWVEA